MLCTAYIWGDQIITVHNMGVEIHSAKMLAPSDFIASAASKLDLQQSTLHDSINSFEDTSVEFAETKVRDTLTNIDGRHRRYTAMRYINVRSEADGKSTSIYRMHGAKKA